MSDLPTVLFVNTPAQMGGSNRSMVNVLASLEGRVHRILASPGFGELRRVALEEGVADEYVELPRRPGSAFDRLLRIAAGLKIGWWAWRRRHTLTAIHANALTGLNLSALGAKLSGATTVVWIHDPVGSPWGNRLGRLMRRLLPDLTIAAVSETAESVAVANGLCSAGDAVIIPNPIDPDDVLAAERTRGEGKVRIGVLGGASHRKGFDLLPDVIESVGDQDVEWHLFVSSEVEPGMEPTWQRLRSFPAGRVTIHEKVFDVATVYARLDVVFCPSRAESFCRVAAEAMLNGIPVVGSDIAPIRDLLGVDEAGILFSLDNPEQSADALLRLIGDQRLRQRLGRAGTKRASVFHPDAIAARLFALYTAG